MEMRVAKPADIQSVEHEDNEIEQNLAQLQNVFNGPNIEIAVSWPRGNRDGVLSRNSINRLVRWASRNRLSVERMKIKISEEDDAIDILTETITPSEILTLESNDVEYHYAERRGFLARAFETNRDIIRRIYHP